jgi:hypothetical protein
MKNESNFNDHIESKEKEDEEESVEPLMIEERIEG